MKLADKRISHSAAAFLAAVIIAFAPPLPAQTVSGINAFHRSGQTFLTWNEIAAPGASYHVYRRSVPITTANLDQAARLTSRWGAIPEGSAAYLNERERENPVQRNFIIADDGPELSDATGLFVRTTHENGIFYYAVTVVSAGAEDRTIVPGANATTAGLSESVADPFPVRVYRTENGRGFVFTHFMDYGDWNPTFDGYAYNYSVALPPGYDGFAPVPLMIYLQGWGGRYGVNAGTPYDWDSIWVEIDDPRQTWHYGFNADCDYRALAPGEFPSSGTIVNFTEIRILKAIDEVSRLFAVDRNRVHGHGSSMGGSGMLSLGLRYPDVFSAIYAGLPMTDYRAADGSGGSVDWRGDLQPKWGALAAALPIANRGPHASHLVAYDGTNVWDWQDHRMMAALRRGEETAYICYAHTMQDDVIDWESQGQPFPQALIAGGIGFMGAAVPGGHSWPGFVGSNGAMIGPGYDGWSIFRFRRDMSFPAISNASHSPPLPPPTSASEEYRYNQDIEWSVPWNNFGEGIVDTAAAWGTTLRSTSGEQTADITPRRLQAFVVDEAGGYEWTNRSRGSDGSLIQSGGARPDASGLLTLSGVVITAAGNRLRISRLVYAADLNDDGVVDSRDFGILLSSWGDGGGRADLTGDGKVDEADLSLLLAQWSG